MLAVIANKTIAEGSLLSFAVVATDSDLPSQTLTFGFGGNAPAGANINPATGAFSWIPTEAQGPSTNVITVRVTDNGTPSLSANTIFTVIVNEVNLEPVLATLADQTILLGETLTVRVTASDSDLPPNQLTFSLEAGSPNGAGIDPKSGLLTWTPSVPQAPSTDRITVRVTDNGSPALSDRKSFTVAVQPAPPANQSPRSSLTQPLNRAVFKPGSAITLQAEASDPDGRVSKVEFFQGANKLGEDTSSPFSFTWTNVPEGDYVLTARATDNLGATALSSPVRIAVSEASSDAEVALVRSLPDPEIDQLQEYLFEMGLSSRVFDQEGLSIADLQSAKLIIGDNLGGAPEWTDRTVNVFSEAFTKGIALYFIGEHLAGALAKLSDPQRLQWRNLIHLNEPTSRVNNPAITVPASTVLHPILRGRFGFLESFPYDGPVELATWTGGESEVFGEVNGAPVLLSAPGVSAPDLGQVRTFTQNIRVWAGTDGFSLGERKKLFQNVVYWLLRGPTCGNLNMRLKIEGPAGPVKVSEPIAYTLRLSHDGRCEATGVVVRNQLPAGVRLLSVQTPQGSLATNDNVVVFNVGRIPTDETREFRVVVQPLSGGTITNTAVVRLNEVESHEDNEDSLTTVVVGTEPGMGIKLSIKILGGGLAEITLEGPKGQACVLEASADLRTWSSIRTIVLANGRAEIVDPDSAALPQRFYRARVGQ